MKHTKKLLAALLAALMLIATVGCSASAPAAPSADSSAPAANAPAAAPAAKDEAAPVKDTLNIGIKADHSTIAPVYQATYNDQFGYGIYEPLYFTAASGERVMWLAESAEVIDDTHMLVKLKDGITDSAGNPFTASDVIYVFERSLNDFITAMYTPYIDIPNCKVIDDLTLEIVLTEPNIVQWYLLGGLPMFTKAAMEASPDEMLMNPVGTGPYELVEYVPGSSVKLTAREGYWGEAPAIKNVNYIVISETAQRAIALESGDIDVAIELAVNDYNRFESNNAYTTFPRYRVRNYSLEYNCSTESICNDTKVRQAISYAVDAAGILAAAFNNSGDVTKCITANPTFGKDNDWFPDYYNYNPEKAKQLLAEAGIAEGTPITVASQGGQEGTIAEIVQTMLNAVGFDCKILTYDKATWTSVRRDANSGIDIGIQVFSSPEGYFSNQIWSAVISSGTNHFESNPRYQELYDLVKESMRTSDAAAQLVVNKKIADIMYEEIPGYGLVDQVWLYASDSDVAGLEDCFTNYSNIVPSALSFK